MHRLIWTLASTVEISEGINRWFRRSSSLSETAFWAMILLAILALWVGLYYWDRARRPQQQAQHGREGLFLQLCELHKLSKNERLFLKKVARSQRLDQPAMTFVNPHILIQFAEAEPERLLEVRTLAGRLFGKSLVEDIVHESSTGAVNTDDTFERR